VPRRPNSGRKAVRRTLIAAATTAVSVSGVTVANTAAAAPVSGPVAPSTPAQAKAAADAAAAAAAAAAQAAAPLEGEYAKHAADVAAAQVRASEAQAKIDAAAAEEKVAREELFRAEAPVRQAERRVDAADEDLIDVFHDRRALDNPFVGDVASRKAAVERAESAVHAAERRVERAVNTAEDKIETAEDFQDQQAVLRDEAQDAAAKSQAEADAVAAGELSGLRANRAAADAALAAAAGHAQSVADTNPWYSRLVLPATGRVTSPFGMRLHPVLGSYRMHTGIDFAIGDGAVYAAAAGVVVATGYNGGYGNITTIDHGVINGVHVTTKYAHQAAFGVAVGQSVAAGQAIGAIGSTGRSTGPHLHFELRHNDVPVNPAGWLAI
jgi:murein DD-endopeptidase MepM/ murein hydrolase activator NlpD